MAWWGRKAEEEKYKIADSYTTDTTSIGDSAVLNVYTSTGTSPYYSRTQPVQATDVVASPEITHIIWCDRFINLELHVQLFNACEELDMTMYDLLDLVKEMKEEKSK